MSPFGALLIIVGSLSAAGALTRDQVRRMRALSDISGALSHLRAEMSLRLTGLPALAEELSKSAQGAAGQFFNKLSETLGELGEKNFSVLWEEAARSVLSGLRNDELEPFLRLGESLGRYEVGEQLAALTLCIDELERRAAILSASLPERRRLAFGLCGAAGALLCILLI